MQPFLEHSIELYKRKVKKKQQNRKKTWKFKHMLTAIVHLKQQKW